MPKNTINKKEKHKINETIKTITQQPKTSKNPNIFYIKPNIIEHPKPSH